MGRISGLRKGGGGGLRRVILQILMVGIDL